MKVSCPTCGVRLSAPEDLLGKPVNCQKCNTKFVLSRRWMNEPLMVPVDESQLSRNDDADLVENASLLREESSMGSSADPILEMPEPLEGSSSSGDSLASELSESPSLMPGKPTKSLLIKNPATEPIFRPPRNVSMDLPTPGIELLESTTSLQDYRETNSLFDFFDFRFRRYLTPGIVRISWFLILLVSAVWLLLLSYFYLSSLLQRTNFEFPEIRTNSAVPIETTNDSPVFKIPQFFYNSALYFTYLIASTIALLWTRVLFETVIMVFSIGTYLSEKKGKG